jgi:hypothetical protein
MYFSSPAKSASGMLESRELAELLKKKVQIAATNDTPVYV